MDVGIHCWVLELRWSKQSSPLATLFFQLLGGLAVDQVCARRRLSRWQKELAIGGHSLLPLTLACQGPVARSVLIGRNAGTALHVHL